MQIEDGRHLFGEDAAGYDAARPDYPEVLYRLLRDHCGLTPGFHGFEVGPGTGTATRRLLGLSPSRLVAIEPDRRLVQYLAGHAEADRLRIVSSPFEQADLPAGTFDVGFAATAFHWLDQPDALAKVMRLLRPGGWWAMWWTLFDDPDDPDDFQRAADTLFLELPQSASVGDGRSRPFALQTETRLRQMQEAGMRDTGMHRMRWSIVMSVGQIRSLVATFSAVIRLDPASRLGFLDRVEALVQDRFGGKVERRFVTVLYLGRKLVG